MDCSNKIDCSLIVKVVFISFILFLTIPSNSHAEYQYVFCPDAVEEDVLISFSYASDVSFNVTTAYESRVVTPCPGCTLKLKGYADSLGYAFISYSSGFTSVTVNSCSKYQDEVWFNGLMGLAGVLCAGLFFYGIHSAYLN